MIKGAWPVYCHSAALAPRSEPVTTPEVIPPIERELEPV